MEAVSKGLYRLGVVYGQPYGTDKHALQQLAKEWLAALADMPSRIFDQAVTDWIATEKKWPRPVDLREKSSAKVGAALHRTTSATKVHKERIQPSGAMRVYPYMRSKLRMNPHWDAFLDSIHPTEEHNYFVESVFGKSSKEIKVISGFRQDYILSKFGERMAAHFGSPVSVIVSLNENYDRVPHSGDGN